MKRAYLFPRSRSPATDSLSLHCFPFGKEPDASLGNAIEPLKEKARSVGANGIIIDKSNPIKSGMIFTGIYVEARAIRLKVKP